MSTAATALRIKLPDTIINRLRIMAQAAGSNTLEPYLRNVLEDHSKTVMRESYEKIRAARKVMREKHGTLPKGTGADLIREDRDMRG
ncbi:MAG: hypothetical protein AAF988_07815 [Pseudomonadota bacterium]